MTEKTKSWAKENILSLIIITMFSTFWVQYQNDADKNTKAHLDLLSSGVKFNARQITVCTILINDPDTDPYYREILREWIKVETRGN